ncbi:MAG: alpha/beta fold hydrolase [Bacillota bacterium]|nr:alpha/beta fold hydrolase [Bacillota bacterium]
MEKNIDPKYMGKEFWKNYMEMWFGRELIEKWSKYVKEETIYSNDRDIHLEVYDTGYSDRPTLIFAHGIAGYARVLLPFLVPIREKGYNIIAPDLQGYGYNSGLKGDFEWNAHVQNLYDTVVYAKKRFSGKIILGGASMGGPLAYATATRFGNVDAIACWCLWDFSDREFMLKQTNTKSFTYLLIPLFKLLSLLVGNIRLKTYSLIPYDTLSDSSEMNELIKRDPQAGTYITLKGATSLVLQSTPDIPHHKFKLPVLVVQPGADRMTPIKYTERTFEKLGSKNKRYVKLVGADHFPTKKTYYHQWAEEFDNFVQQI